MSYISSLATNSPLSIQTSLSLKTLNISLNTPQLSCDSKVFFFFFSIYFIFQTVRYSELTFIYSGPNKKCLLLVEYHGRFKNRGNIVQVVCLFNDLSCQNGLRTLWGCGGGKYSLKGRMVRGSGVHIDFSNLVLPLLTFTLHCNFSHLSCHLPSYPLLKISRYVLCT